MCQPAGTTAGLGNRGAAIIEEWTAWFLVRERERELTRKLRLREAERARAGSRHPAPANVMKLPVPARPPEVKRPPRGRRAA
ncbi:MAG TPA: hypothetical protein VI007_11285 [bacterium]